MTREIMGLVSRMWSDARDEAGAGRHEDGRGPSGPAGVGGWLIVFCLLLLVWQPISLGVVASSVVDALPVGGAPLAVLLLIRLLVTSLGISAGLALLGKRAYAPTLAKASLVASAATDTLVYSTSLFPSNRLPGETPFVIAASLAYYAVWLTYLSRSRRVRNTY
jgi:Protein of unknown function (DUF2569)